MHRLIMTLATLCLTAHISCIQSCSKITNKDRRTLPGSEDATYTKLNAWTFKPHDDLSKGSFRFGLIVDGTQNPLRLKFSAEKNSVKVLYCDTLPLSNCALGLGKFFITDFEAERPNDKVFTALQEFEFADGKEIVIVALDAQNNVISENYGTLVFDP